MSENFYLDLEHFGTRTALLNSNEIEVSYETLSQTIDALVVNIETRSLVFCICSNSISFLEGYLGFLRSGHVVVMLSEQVKHENFWKLVRSYQPNFAWLPRMHKSALGVDKYEVRTSNFEYELLALSKSRIDMHKDLALMLFTSGSTGSPQTVRLSYSNIVSNAADIADGLALRETDRAFTTLPMNYTYGLSIVHSALAVGGSIFLNESAITERNFWSDLKLSKATTFGGVPYTYEMLNRFGIKRLAGTDVRLLTQAGGRLDHKLVASTHIEAAEIGIDFCVMYGQTEATARMSILKSHEIVTHESSIGKPLRNCSFEIVDTQTGNLLPRGEKGLLKFYGPNVSMGYAQVADDLELGDLNQGCIETGDIAYECEDGFYYIIGRLKRFVKLNGIRINLDDIESYLNGLGIVAACIGTDEGVTVFIQSDEAEDLIQKTIANYLSVRSGMVSVQRIPAIPRTDAGKIMYSELRGLEQYT